MSTSPAESPQSAESRESRESVEPSQRATPFFCPYCGEDTSLRPEPQGRWHCRACLRLFSVTFHGLQRPEIVMPGSTAGTTSSTSTTGSETP